MDIDVDLQSTFESLTVFPNAIRASMVKDNDLTAHTVGVYFQSIPVDKLTGLSAIPYDHAEEFGFMKVDFLHLIALDPFSSKEEIRELVKIQPDWNLLQVPSVVKKLVHINKYYDLLIQVKPHSVQELADVLALIRPGKKELLEDYLDNREEIRKELYKKPKDGKYYFKKSHAISYSLTICLQLHLIKSGKI